MIYTDRSRIQAYDECHRLRFLGYHWGGTGLQRVENALPLLDGLLIHEGTERCAMGEDPDDVTNDIINSFKQELTAKGIRNQDDVPAWFINEQTCLLKGLILTWTKFRLPFILQEYDIVSIETELPWEMVPGTLVDMTRCDIILRRKKDKALFILEFKTLSTISDGWQEQWEHNSQVLANTLAVEEQFHEPVMGMLIEGLCKGKHAKDRAQTSEYLGYKIQQSPLCYVYKDPTSDPVEYSYDYKRSWVKVPVWDSIGTDRLVAEMDVDTARKIIVPCPPIKPDTAQLASWKRQTIAKEQKIERDLAVLNMLRNVMEPDPAYNSTFPAELDARFPQNFNHCRRYWGHPCPFESICFNAQIAADPLGSGLYERRVPHHELERQVVEETSTVLTQKTEATDAII